jgi:hypothetical protein
MVSIKQIKISNNYKAVQKMNKRVKIAILRSLEKPLILKTLCNTVGSIIKQRPIIEASSVQVW